ncbi:MAG: hypothetical protein Unbinned3987contig1001_29 [Prokaryotic dsDNA virus sp.]|mgnify:CR=1 FL=1|jgi:RNA polymerase sigma factor (sigma-70 family)|nr:MAG: hypothetical protein Unbinned3987contig1001_29 [Prokaryotic dsDNA virus sp.]|tara:strand:- start:1321 stop:1854 length:534 start_codon:yes stop_codon:yes gene_type:complete
MSELDEFLKCNYEKLQKTSTTITGGNSDSGDLLHETILILYNKIDRGIIVKLINENKFIFFIVRIMVNQYHSKTSPYHKKYRKYYEILDLNIELTGWKEYYLNIMQLNGIKQAQEFEKKLHKAQKILNNLDWFDAEVFRIYHMMGHSLNSMAKETGINRNTLYKSIKNVKNKLNDEK